ncbi:hypothetical protein [Nostoc piscinale]|uniref:hypothetical protein n=1 Tax=Nostoc piscinale TaxID=224012 RepID=UPI000AEAEFC7|nr:hypothetical protein [Nostoc piscinale]
MTNSELYLRIEIFYIKLQAGDYDHPHHLAMALEALANHAWDDVDNIYLALP